ncbi:uracil-DNA glycosylase [bacterium]|nr:uracil-DNA glycosylase [bacterium]RQV97968.1 MAG: uracil-DNA glycosylase [bacterium]
MNLSCKYKAVDELNKRINKCTVCRLSLTRKHVLTGEGDINARLMMIALSPGEKEDSENRMFIGPSGQILNKLFDKAKMLRESVYITNLIKCMLPKNRRPKTDEINACSPFLEEEIAVIDPEIIVPLGFYATRSVLMKYHADLPSARSEFTSLYGRLIFSDDQKIFPLPHPASLLYHPSFESKTEEKYIKLNIFLHDCKWFPVCPMKWYYEKGRLDKKWIEKYCRGDWESCVRFKMEEERRFHHDWMLPDGSIDNSLKPV